jgi:D-3-phosphoglycerate dehydrogenase
MKIAIPDDYQDMVDKLQCFSMIQHHDALHYREPALGFDHLVEWLKGADVVVSIRERFQQCRRVAAR